MKYYNLVHKQTPWGDYSEMLLTGMTAYLDRQDDLLQYQRTGPFQPDLTLSGYKDLLVKNSIKEKIEISDLRGFSFKPVIKRHIVPVNWTAWDMTNDEPEFYPENGEPEGYILDLPHSQELADKMEDVWEVVVPTNGTFSENGTFHSYNPELDIMLPDNKYWFIVTEKAKSWLQQNCDNWIEFVEVNASVL
jgi:hypothetical protein